MAKDPYKPQIVVRDGKPVSVILDIEDYEALLEQVEQLDDLRAIRSMKQEDWKTVSFDDYLRQKDQRVAG